MAKNNRLTQLLVHHHAVIFLLLSAFSLASALISQYGFGLQPCKLCIYQRIPFFLVMAISGYLLISKHISPLAVAMTGIIFALGAILAGYHAGVEWGIFAGPENCAGSGTSESLDKLLISIQEAEVVRCDEPAFVFLGLSMAGWNVLWSGFLSLCAFYILYNIRNHANR